jgi:hypothetical protein
MDGRKWGSSTGTRLEGEKVDLAIKRFTRLNLAPKDAYCLVKDCHDV